MMDLDWTVKVTSCFNQFKGCECNSTIKYLPSSEEALSGFDLHKNTESKLMYSFILQDEHSL